MSWKKELPRHSRYPQKTAEQSLRHYPGKRFRGGAETLDYETKEAPLWKDGHGRIVNN